MAKYPKDTQAPADQPDDEIQVAVPTARPMTLQEAASAFRTMLNGWRGMARMGEAMEAALTVEQQTRQIEQRRAEAQTALDKIAEDRKLADEGLALARQGLVGVQDATRVAREEQEAVRRQIKEEQAAETRRQAEARKAWDAERAAVDKEIAAKQAQLDAVRAELAEVVKRHAPAAA